MHTALPSQSLFVFLKMDGSRTLVDAGAVWREAAERGAAAWAAVRHRQPHALAGRGTVQAAQGAPRGARRSGGNAGGRYVAAAKDRNWELGSGWLGHSSWVKRHCRWAR